MAAHVERREPSRLARFVGNRYFVLLVRILLGAVFLYSSADKVSDPARFAVAVRGYEILPTSITNIFALVLAWSELIAGVMVVLGVYTRKAAGAIFLLLVMFVVAIATTMLRGLTIDCGCFSNEGGTKTGSWLIVRNLFLIAASLVVMRFESGFGTLSSLFSKRADAR